jgi:hypothetical protein
MTRIANTGISFAEETSEDIFLYSGAWYKHAGGTWYSARTLGGAWSKIAAPPAAFEKIPANHIKAYVRPAGKTR